MIMRRILCFIIVALSLASCGKNLFDETAICFAAEGNNATRAMMDDADLKTAGNKLKIYDELTGFTGKVSWMDENNPYYISDELVYNENPIWNYTSGRTYPWTTNGTHKFFSWLSFDRNKTDVQFGASFDATTKVLSIALKDMNIDAEGNGTEQFDFMYSDIVTVPAASHTSGSPINLHLHHLFTAFEINVLNTSGNTILLESVTLTGMKNKRSASINFSSSEVAVSTANVTSTDMQMFTSDDSAEGGYGTEYINEDVVKELTEFIMMWPQTYTELNGAQLEVKYKVKSTGDTPSVSDELTSIIALNNLEIFKRDNLGMDAGVKYTFQLQFKKSTLDIRVRALPWEYEEYDWNYADHSISARSGKERGGVLVFYRRDPNTGEYTIPATSEEWSAKTMRFTTRNEILKGRFYIEAPTSGRWQVTAYPASAAEYFLIEPTSGDIDAFTNDGEVEFTVKVNPDRTNISSQTLFFNVAIYFNGECHDANSEFNRKNLRLLLDAN